MASAVNCLKTTVLACCKYVFLDDMIIQMSGKDETDVVYTINEGKALRS